MLKVDSYNEEFIHDDDRGYDGDDGGDEDDDGIVRDDAGAYDDHDHDDKGDDAAGDLVMMTMIMEVTMMSTCLEVIKKSCAVARTQSSSAT